MDRKLEVTRIALQIIRDFEQLYYMCNEPDQIKLYGKPTKYSIDLRSIACERLSNANRMSLKTIDKYVKESLVEAYTWAQRPETKEWISKQIDNIK